MNQSDGGDRGAALAHHFIVLTKNSVLKQF